MPEFTPKSGSLKIETFDDPPPVLTMNIRIEFREPMDPEEPGCTQSVKAEFDDLAVPFESGKDLAHATITNPIIEDVSESTIYYRGYHNPIELNSISFAHFEGTGVLAILTGTIDFSHEGLSQLGKPEFMWKVLLQLDEETD
ncbi:hypothetical protein Enr10x_04680 [Gimesia panareensis]|uniref:Uncharacterized protein n=1 Tax=Gimesia panareensis TaxID=2527978 RepID=A0A517Q0M0_9PLAN|nr:hypothetical protein [Gimesia panareensis]QDT25173.1 hypothetical protein Enr10x_04680 [Gimesia panareensis]